MATIRIKVSSNIIFQLLQKNLAAQDEAGRQWKEIKVFPMTTLPANLTYSEASRVQITQTTPEEGFIDKYGSQLMQVRLSGTFGLQVRRQGVSLKDGYTRLLEFRDEVFRASNRVRQFAGEKNIAFLKEQTNGNYVYAINFYDFIYDEQHCINFNSFVRTLSAQKNGFVPDYDLSFTTLGRPIQVTSKDPLLILLLGASDLIDKVTSGLDSVATAITPVTDVLNFGVEGLDLLADINTNLATLFTQFGGAIAGQVSNLGNIGANAATTNNAPGNALKNSFAQIKG